MRATDVWEMLVAGVIRTQPQTDARFCFDALRASGHSVPRVLYERCVCLQRQTQKLTVAMPLLPVSGTLRAMDKGELRAGHDTASSGVY